MPPTKMGFCMSAVACAIKSENVGHITLTSYEHYGISNHRQADSLLDSLSTNKENIKTSSYGYRDPHDKPKTV